MKNKRSLFLAVAASLVVQAGLCAAQSDAGPAVTLDKAALVSEVSNDQRTMLVPGSGRRFLWVRATLSGAPSAVDLSKVVLVSGSDKVPLIGVDSAWDGDPKQFSMIAQARGKDGRTLEPLEETRSTGTVAFAFSPGKTALLKVITPPQSVCLLFSVPEAFRTGEISGLGAKALAVPALAGAKP